MGRSGFIPLSSVEANGKCKNCGAELTGRRTSYCSDECAHEFFVKNNWQALANKLKREADYTCQRCGKRGRAYCSEVHEDRIEAHHIVPIYKGGDEFDPDNVVVVCHKCHMELHRRLERDEQLPSPELIPILDEWIKDLLEEKYQQKLPIYNGKEVRQ